MSAATLLLQVSGLSLRYGSNVAVNDVHVNVAQGEFVALVGANGAGKSSLLKAIVGLEPVFAGQVLFAGTDITSMAAHQRVASGIAFVPEGRGVFSTMSVAENLELGSFLRSSASQRSAVAADLARVFELFPRLAERRQQIAGTLSGGEQQMLAIGRALMTNPKLLILDEATEGLAPVIRAEIWTCLEALKREGLSILVVDKNVGVLRRLADRHFVIERGRTVWSGDGAALDQDREKVNGWVGL